MILSGKRTARRRVLIVDPSLRRQAGHPYHASRAVETAAAAAGLDTVVLASRTARGFGFGGRFRRCLSRSLYGRTDWSKAAYEADAAALAAGIGRGLGRWARPVAAIVMPTSDQAQLRAIGGLIADGRLPKDVAILGWLLFPPRWNVDVTAAGVEVQLDEYRDALAVIAAARGGPDGEGVTRLCCETESLRDYYGARLEGAEICLAPAPSLAGEARPGTGGAGAMGHPHFVMAGHATAAKGYELLPAALRAVLAADDRPAFTIHGVTEGAGNPAGHEVLAALAQLGPRVRVLTDELGSADYYDLIRLADVLLLPYRLPDYRDRGSGIFNEAVRFGIPVVAPAGAGFAAAAFRERRAVAMRDYSAAALAEALAEASRDLATLTANCSAHQLGNAAPSEAVLDAFFGSLSL